MNINIKLIQRIGYTLIVSSIVIFSISVYSFYNGTQTSTAIIAAGSHIEKPFNGSVSAGDDLLYSITPLSGNASLSAYLVGPGNITTAFSNLSGASYTVTKEIVSPASGQWHVEVMNEGLSNLSVKITVGHLEYGILSLFLIGFSLLPSGIALVILAIVIRRRELRRDRY